MPYRLVHSRPFDANGDELVDVDFPDARSAIVAGGEHVLLYSTTDDDCSGERLAIIRLAPGQRVEWYEPAGGRKEKSA